MAAETYDNLVERQSEAIAEAIAEAADDALLIQHRWGKPLQTVCKEIAERAGTPDMWKALYSRARRLAEKALFGDESAPSQAQSDDVKSARSAIKKHPDLASEMVSHPKVRDAIRRALDAYDED